MPIYEYRCLNCGRKASIFFRTMAAVDPNPACPVCGERRLERRMSRVWSRRSVEDGYPEPTFEDDGIPFYGPDPYGDPFGGGFDEAGDGSGDAEDVAAMAREARMMAEMMGEPLDAEFDAALRHVEQGADPDEVFGELDAAEAAREPAPSDDEP